MAMKKAKIPKKKNKDEVKEEYYLDVPLNQEYVMRKGLAYLFKSMIGIKSEENSIMLFSDYTPGDSDGFVDVTIIMPVERLDSEDVERLTAVASYNTWPGDGEEFFFTFDIQSTVWDIESNKDIPAVMSDGTPGFWLKLEISIPKKKLDFKQMKP